MKRRIITAVLAGMLLSGCGAQRDPAVLLNAIATTAAKCEGDGACIATLNAAIYAGGLLQDENSTPRVIASFIPVLNIGLELTRIILGYSGGGNGGGFVLNRSNGNTFILNKQNADRSSSIDAPFSMTTANTENYSWQNMYNQDYSTK